MANEEHLARLKQGIEAWNQWREASLDITPDLRQVDLEGANLHRANLYGADLHEANLYGAILDAAILKGANLRGANLARTTLKGANLRGADLYRTDLHGADLHGADLREADLYGANLGADLHGADLHEANLWGANLGGANLDGTNFDGTSIGWTIFGDVDLSTARGLETIQHQGSSTIGIDTLYRSHGNIPEAFLRGAGVPDEMITYVKSLVGRPFEYHSCFISYSTKDTGLAERLYTDLQATGVRCWYAPEDMKIGDKFRSRIDEAIHLHDKLLLILSKHSLESPWVEKEVETAFAKERKESRLVLFPVRVDQAIMQRDTGWAVDIHRTRHIGDFRRWKNHDAYKKSFDRLLRDLKAGSQ